MFRHFVARRTARACIFGPSRRDVDGAMLSGDSTCRIPIRCCLRRPPGAHAPGRWLTVASGAAQQRTTAATDDVVNLTVHGIGAHTRALEPGEQAVWITVDQFERALDRIAGRDDVRLTFDDGNLSDVEIALPMLSTAS